MTESNLRQRQVPKAKLTTEDVVQAQINDTGKTFGRTPDGTVFEIPQTHDVLSGLFDPRLHKSAADVCILASLALQCLAYFFLPIEVARYFFMLYFAGWRLAYNAGLGYILSKQSKSKWIVRKFKQTGLMDPDKNPTTTAWFKSALSARMGSDYEFESAPFEYNVWLAFRHLVDLILLNDFLAYCFCAFSWYTDLSQQYSLAFNSMRWLFGCSLIIFNIFVKADAHRIVKDLAWYWSDVFFMGMQDLVFDGVFELAPHPMYSVGYAGYYGLSLIIGSQTILFVSLAAHMSQFAFLLWFENPHIARTYGKPKPLASRTPLSQLSSNPGLKSDESGSVSASGNAIIPGTAHDFSSHQNSYGIEKTEEPAQYRPATQHDLHNRYFLNELVITKNFDVFRARDFGFAFAALYSVFFTWLPPSTPGQRLAFAFLNALFWRLFHSAGLGMILYKQSSSRWLVRHFLKYYFYEHKESFGPVQDAFRNWIGLYNLSLGMTYISFVGLAWNCYTLPEDWTVASVAMRHTFGLLLIALHCWTARETFEVLGTAGWFYADFFLEEYPKTLYYTGIYRFLNNPERIMGGAAFFGLTLISGSKLVASLAMASVAGHLAFLTWVENPHMQRLYGDAIRKESGVSKTLRNVARQNATKAPPEVQRKLKTFGGTFERVYGDATEAIEGMIDKSRPMVAEYIQDTKFMLAQSQDMLPLTRISNLHGLDLTEYSLKIRNSISTEAGGNYKRFHLGQAIALEWTAPHQHARSDWIGIYPIEANSSKTFTRAISHGRWSGLYQEDWQGDVFVSQDQPKTDTQDSIHTGSVTFGHHEVLPANTGRWEARYHHAGRHSVLALSESMEIYVARPSDPDKFTAVYETLQTIVRYCLQENPEHMPATCLTREEEKARGQAGTSLDQDDFVLYTQQQAKLISYSLKEAFETDLASEVVIASSNLKDLAARIIEARKLLKPWPRDGIAG